MYLRLVGIQLCSATLIRRQPSGPGLSLVQLSSDISQKTWEEIFFEASPDFDILYLEK